MLDDLFLDCFGTHSDNGQRLGRSILDRYGYTVQHATTWCYGEGDIPVLLVAHTDTVFPHPPTQILYARKQGIISGTYGIGADDRAGVWAIARLLREGYRPHVLFTDLEECGAHGATDASYDLRKPDVHCIIQIDRRGSDDAVYYGCGNLTFQQYVTDHGFTTAQGSFSDISILAPAWNIAAVNVSAGYYHEHTEHECLHLNQLDATIDRVDAMLRDPPDHVHKYERRKRRNWQAWDDTDWRYR